MDELPRDEWIQAFCLLLATVDPHAFDGALLRVAGECWKEERGNDPADAVQRLLIERELDRRVRSRP